MPGDVIHEDPGLGEQPDHAQHRTDRGNYPSDSTFVRNVPWRGRTTAVFGSLTSVDSSEPRRSLFGL